LPLARQSAIFAPPPAPAPPSFPTPWGMNTAVWERPDDGLLAAARHAVSDDSILLNPPTTPRSGMGLVGIPGEPIDVATLRAHTKPPAAPATPFRPPAGPPLWQRLLRRLTFWRFGGDPIACTLLTPPTVLPGETATLQVVAHHANRSQQ